MKGRAITGAQKEKIILKLLSLWKKRPELRLGQLIGNYLESELYYIEDFDLIERLEKSYGI